MVLSWLPSLAITRKATTPNKPASRTPGKTTRKNFFIGIPLSLLWYWALLAVQDLIHPLTDIAQVFFVASAQLNRGIAFVADLLERLVNLFPLNIAFAEIDEFGHVLSQHLVAAVAEVL